MANSTTASMLYYRRYTVQLHHVSQPRAQLTEALADGPGAHGNHQVAQLLHLRAVDQPEKSAAEDSEREPQ